MSISKARKQTTSFCAQTPGVGAYQIKAWQKVSQVRKEPCAIITKTKKFFDPLVKKQFNLGPGSYHPEKLQTKIQYSMRGKTQASYDNHVPSPVDYNPSKKSHQRQYSFTLSTRKFEAAQGPGPAQYRPRQNYHVKGGNLPQQKRDRIRSLLMPGPGQYQIQKPESPKRENQISFPREKKFILAQLQQKTKSKLPGPGAYTIDHDLSSSRSIKFEHSSRMKTETGSGSGPGPGAYSPESMKKVKIPQVVIGSEKRLTASFVKVPGPGTYQVLNKKAGAAIFGHQKRLKTLIQRTPGPGEYNVGNFGVVGGYDKTYRKFYQKQDKTPSPKHYNPEYRVIPSKNIQSIFEREGKISKITNRSPNSGQKDMNKTNKTLMLSQVAKTDKFVKESQNLKKVGGEQDRAEKYRKFMMQV